MIVNVPDGQFFEPGKTYIQKSWEDGDPNGRRETFQCVAVAVHPRDGQLRAFGFGWAVSQHPEWARSVAKGPRQWRNQDGEEVWEVIYDGDA